MPMLPCPHMHSSQVSSMTIFFIVSSFFTLEMLPLLNISCPILFLISQLVPFILPSHKQLGWCSEHCIILAEHYLLVVVPGVCLHMLDVGLHHTPNNHIITTPPPQLLPNAQLFQVSITCVFLLICVHSTCLSYKFLNWYNYSARKSILFFT